MQEYQEYKEKALREIQKQLGHDNMQTGIKHYVVEGEKDGLGARRVHGQKNDLKTY